MSAKRFNSRCVMIVLLATCLLAAGCASTSSQTALNKPHKPQIITAKGPEEVGQCPAIGKFEHGFDLSENWASFLATMGPVFEILGGLANR